MARGTPKKKRFVSFLIVSDDYSEPINFKLSVRSIKILIGVGILLGLHIIVGGVFYYSYFVLHHKNKELKMQNTKLERENSRIYTLAARAKQVETILKKLKISLGIEPGTLLQGGVSEKALQTVQLQTRAAQQVPPVAKFLNSKRIHDTPFRSVSNRKSTFHAVFDNYPTFLPVDGVISRQFDRSKIHKPLSRYHHFGIDIAARKGSVIHAAGSGFIVFAGWTTDLGNLVILYHGNGIFTYYAHNMRLLREGGYVKKGEPIALLGSSGRTSTAPHLHFEIWREGQPVDPKEYIFSLQTPAIVEKGL